MERIERSTSPLPRECSTTELHGRKTSSLAAMPRCKRPALPRRESHLRAKYSFSPHLLFSAQQPPMDGAGEGNRTLVVSLEGFCSTIELHPRLRSQKSDDRNQ